MDLDSTSDSSEWRSRFLSHTVLSKCLNKCHLLKNVCTSQETFEPGAAVQAALYKFVLQTFSFHAVQLRHSWPHNCAIILQIYLIAKTAEAPSALLKWFSESVALKKELTLKLHNHLFRADLTYITIQYLLWWTYLYELRKIKQSMHIWHQSKSGVAKRHLCPQTYINDMMRKDKQARFNYPIYIFSDLLPEFDPI